MGDVGNGEVGINRVRPWGRREGNWRKMDARLNVGVRLGCMDDWLSPSRKSPASDREKR